MAEYESLRLENIRRNKELLKELEIDKPILQPPPSTTQGNGTKKPAAKRRKVESVPTRTSSRISASQRPSYAEEPDIPKQRPTKATAARKSESPTVSAADLPSPKSEEDILSGWTWKPSAPPPTRGEDGIINFADYPDFTPNKTPEEIIREGCFGGTYFRPLFSKKLNFTVANDYQELPEDWLANLDVGIFLTSATYQPSINKYGVACGQSIEEWEASGWINHDYDVRGWFQWYIRFYLGRRCDDDERQVGRWKKCCGGRGRWRRALLKKYVGMGVREVFDDGEEEGKEVSPVIHQTCHHWAYEVRQPDLDAFWENPA
ncbi:hypothetical protein H072_9384 [Dactylellina haptotyla CBS 200.50]|uniref:Vegetatible incompatibility protein HET-E-1 n=1 Tax=Dactylellina haptotyla (strain CBS 200.50) TaxID=1284197 RepID=S8A2T1_DACHA|nr:hypothetical protein H072_9384 [Dactylellina haptotyla CBS 200.50]